MLKTTQIICHSACAPSWGPCTDLFRRRCCAAAAVPVPLTDPGGLPHDLLVLLLEQVPQQCKLTCCSFVCSAWRDAAAAATSSVQGSVPQPATKLDSLLRWLGNRGQHVTSLSLSKAGTAAAPFHPELLPCAQLQHLTLSKCHLQLTGQSLSRLGPLTRLDMGSCMDPGVPDKELQLDSNLCEGFPGCLVALTQLTSLQHLHVTATELYAWHASVLTGLQRFRPVFPAGVVSHLAHLTHLDFGGFAVTAAALEHLTRLSDLQTLDFGF
jgi:hypothetical protein